MKIARVFPRITKATPTDELAFTGGPPMFGLDVEEVHISVAFTYDMKQAEWLEMQWRALGVPVKMGGPAFNEHGGEFFPGRYLKFGYVITSRGCPNRCVYADGQKCMVPEREGYKLRELPVKDGWNVLDDNFLACSDEHINKVFKMLKRQKERPEFTGGLEAKIIKPWHAAKLFEAKTKRMYFAYDTPDDYEPLIYAGRLLQDAGFKVSSHNMHCYVLIGYKGDTFEKAEKRLNDTIRAGFMPYAMLYKDGDGNSRESWKKYQCEWIRPMIVASKMRKILKLEEENINE
ncbi:MAG TPA: hypothetical protein VN456_12280 [Desulfosporosinus sp.]|nr:hypothetical protein [Desulfosporosinus sp.]